MSRIFRYYNFEEKSLPLFIYYEVTGALVGVKHSELGKSFYS